LRLEHAFEHDLVVDLVLAGEPLLDRSVICQSSPSAFISPRRPCSSTIPPDIGAEQISEEPPRKPSIIVSISFDSRISLRSR